MHALSCANLEKLDVAVTSERLLKVACLIAVWPCGTAEWYKINYLFIYVFGPTLIPVEGSIV
jgi:hypothetical protein